MSIFYHLSQQDFIENYWQQQPFVFRQTFSELNDIVDANELAGLSCEEEVESRIINGHEINGDWQCRQGPFTQDDFAVLDDENWTLLIQGVDQWDENTRNILNHFDFLPRWRLEDIMASYAPVGGSVGPHFDYYDVFLIQISGSREWQIGQHCDHTTKLQDNNQVKLLAEFDTKASHTLTPGDMIYIPAGIAHWGTSLSNDCITFSVGFRAPSENEIVIEALEGLIQRFSSDSLANNQRFRDTPISIDEHPNKINQQALDQLNHTTNILTADLIKQAVDQAFGRLVTDPRYSPFDDDEEKSWSEAELHQLFNNTNSLRLSHTSNSRFAFSETQLFVNGDAYFVEADFSRAICDKLIQQPKSKTETDILLKLLNQGYINILNSNETN